MISMFYLIFTGKTDNSFTSVPVWSFKELSTNENQRCKKMFVS